MSGGYFNYNQYLIASILDSIEQLIKTNNDPRGRQYSPETIAHFVEAVAVLRIAQVYAQRIDWLVSDDDGEDDFKRWLGEDLDELVEKKQNAVKPHRRTKWDAQ